jgi:hypothetical protein
MIESGGPLDGCGASKVPAPTLVGVDDCPQHRKIARVPGCLPSYLSIASGTDAQGRCGVLMASTPPAYPQVVSRYFASFRVVKSSISAGHAALCAWFDSRQLHRKSWSRSKALASFLFINISLGITGMWPASGKTPIICARECRSATSTVNEINCSGGEFGMILEDRTVAGVGVDGQLRAVSTGPRLSSTGADNEPFVSDVEVGRLVGGHFVQ